MTENIVAIFDKLDIDPVRSNLPGDALDIREDFAILIRQSHGASIGPQVLAMASDFKAAQLNALATHSREQFLHRKSVRELVNFLLLGIDKAAAGRDHHCLSSLRV